MPLGHRAAIRSAGNIGSHRYLPCRLSLNQKIANIQVCLWFIWGNPIFAIPPGGQMQKLSSWLGAACQPPVPNVQSA